MRLKLEGKLAQEWVDEAEKSWAPFAAVAAKKHVVVDLCGVSFVDHAGEKFLERICAAGAILIGSDPMILEMIAEIKARTPRPTPAGYPANLVVIIVLSLFLAMSAVGCALADGGPEETQILNAWGMQ